MGFAYVMPLEISPWGPLGHDLMVLPCLVAARVGKKRGQAGPDQGSGKGDTGAGEEGAEW